MKRYVRSDTYEYTPDDFSNENIAFDPHCKFTESEFKFYYDVLNEFGDWLENTPIVDVWGIDIDNDYVYITMITTGGYTFDDWNVPLYKIPKQIDSAVKYLKTKADKMLFKD